MSDSGNGLSARETARRLLATSQTASASHATPTTPREHARLRFADHPDIVATRERRALARQMYELAGMPSPLFLQRWGPNNPVIDMPDGLSGTLKKTLSNFSSYNYLGRPPTRRSSARARRRSRIWRLGLGQPDILRRNRPLRRPGKPLGRHL